MKIRRLVFPAAVLGLALAACRGPEYAPHQPVDGVDRPHQEAINPHDQPPTGKEME